MERARALGLAQHVHVHEVASASRSIAASDRRSGHDRPARPSSRARCAIPFPGWNEGFTTTAPLAFMALKGQRSFPAAREGDPRRHPGRPRRGGGHRRDRRARRAARRRPGAARSDAAGRVYQLASGDVNPLWARRAVELTALYRRRFYREREEGNRTWNRLLLAARALLRLARALRGRRARPRSRRSRAARSGSCDEAAPRWGAPRLSALADGLARRARRARRSRLEKTEGALGPVHAVRLGQPLRLPLRATSARCGRGSRAADRARVPWAPEALDWRRYWLDVHIPGLEKWVFPGLEEESEKRVHAVRRPTATSSSCSTPPASASDGPRRAARWQGARQGSGSPTASCAAARTRSRRSCARPGVAQGRSRAAREREPAGVGHRLLRHPPRRRRGGPGRPAALRGASSRTSWRTAGRAARAPVATTRRSGAPASPRSPAAAVPGARAALARRGARGTGRRRRRVEGRPGRPRLAHLHERHDRHAEGRDALAPELREPRREARRRSSTLGPGDGMLSVLPLHHTFEFTCGLLVPLSRGAEVDYLDELTADRISRGARAPGASPPWSACRRSGSCSTAASRRSSRRRPASSRGAFDALMKGNAALRDSDLGREPRQAALLAGAPQASAAACASSSPAARRSPEVQKAFRGLGFNLYEGYGLTEAAPVLTVSQPGDKPRRRAASGRRCPGIEVRIDGPGRGRRRRGPRARAERDGRLLARRRARRRGPGADRPGARRRLAAHRRPREARRGRQPHARRPQEGRDPRRQRRRTSTPTSSRRRTAIRSS